MFSRKRWLPLGFVFVGVMGVAGAFYAKSKVEPTLRKKLSEVCPECRINWEQFSIGLAGVKFGGLDFESPKGITVYAVKAKRLEIDINWRQAYRGVLDLGGVRLDQAEIKIMEIAGHNPPAGDPTSLFAVRGIAVTDSSFVYEIREQGKFGRIRLDQINSTISPFGTFPELKESTTVGKAKARLEQSGQVDLQLDSQIFGAELNALIKLSLTGQKLEELNEYFKPIDGVELTGNVVTGNSSVEINGKLLSAWADIRYEKFDVHFQKTKQRSGITAFLSNIVADLKLDEKKLQANGKSVGIKRLPKESTVSFVLRGLKEAALRVATVK